jgi:hypothetical protein
MALITVGDFHIDPWRPAQRAVITHAHGDHLRAGSEAYVTSRAGAALAAATAAPRGGADGTRVRRADGFPWRAGLAASGRARARLRAGADRGIAARSGSSRATTSATPTRPARRSRSCPATSSSARRPSPCRSIAGAPTARSPPRSWAWWQANRAAGVASVLLLRARQGAAGAGRTGALTTEPVYVHGAVDALVEAYREAGVAMVPTGRCRDPKGCARGLRRRTGRRAAGRRRARRGCAASARPRPASARAGCACAATGAGAATTAASCSPTTPTGRRCCARSARPARAASC